MNKYLALLTILTIAGCSSTREIRGPDGSMIYETTCHGTIRSMGDCMENAAETCSGAYEIIGKDSSQGLNSSNGDVYTTESRSMLFKCKK